MAWAVLAWSVAVGVGFALAYQHDLPPGGSGVTQSRAWRDLMAVLMLTVVPAVVAVASVQARASLGALAAGVVVAGGAGLVGGAALLARRWHHALALVWTVGHVVAWVALVRDAFTLVGHLGRLAPAAIAVWLVMTVVVATQVHALADRAGTRGRALLVAAQVVVFPGVAVALWALVWAAGPASAFVLGATALLCCVAPGGPLVAVVAALAKHPGSEEPDEDTVFLPRRAARPPTRNLPRATGEPTMTLWYAPRVPSGDLPTVQPTLVARQRSAARLPAVERPPTPGKGFSGIPTTPVA